MNIEYINPIQPIRPRFTEDSKFPLRFRTRPKLQRRMIKVHTYANQIAAMRLYRAVRNGDVPQQVGVADLHQFIAPDKAFSKVTLGYVVINSVDYEPRQLVNSKKVEKPTQSYAFRDVKELEYGLEWIICSFLRKFLNQYNAADLQINTQEAMEEELDILATQSHQEQMEMEADLRDFMTTPIIWMQHSIDYKWEFQEVYPRYKPETPVPQTPPVDLSKAF